MKTSKMMWVCSADNTIKVDTSYQALQLATENPAEPKYLLWVQMLVISEAV